MKTFLTTLVLASSLSASAGTLLNNKTGESIEFNLDQDNSSVEVISRTIGLKSKYIALEKVAYKPLDQGPLMSLTDSYLDEVRGEWGVVGAYLAPIVNIPTIGANIIDTLALPVKLPMRMIRNKRHTKDYNALSKAIVTDSNVLVKVSDKRFRRIVNIVNDIRGTESMR